MAAPSIVVSPTPSSRVSLETTDSTRRISLDSQRSAASRDGSISGSNPAGGAPNNNNNNNNSSNRRAHGSVRNRSALREFYGLKKRDDSAHDSDSSASGRSRGRIGLGISTTSPSSTTNNNNNNALQSPLSSPSYPEMDRNNFDAEIFVSKLVAREDLRGLLRVENELVNDIRGLDGDRKSLVYDNYNKLITATDTIRSMRSSMDPLTPATSTLFPAVAHIADISASLVGHTSTTSIDGTKGVEEEGGGQRGEDTEVEIMKRKRRETVKWVLDCPSRMEKMIAEGKKDDAVREWEVAMKIMGKWKGVGGGGLEELKKRGNAVLGL